jgi:hypothetical protein
MIRVPSIKNNWKQYCEVRLKDGIVNQTVIDMKRKIDVVRSDIGDRNRTVISIGIPSVGSLDSDRGIGPLSSSFVDTFLPYFIKSITREELELFEFRIYVGYDVGDPVYDNPERVQLLQHRVLEMLRKVGASVKVIYIRLPFSNAWLTFIWNSLYLISINDGTDYYFQANDDLQLLKRGWATSFVSKLRENNDIGTYFE